MHRVLRPSGRVAILEFSTPPWAPFRAVFGFYFHRILPRIGRMLASGGDQGGAAYSYLPESVESFPDPEGLSRRLAESGFSSVRYRRLSLGIAVVHLAERPAEAGLEPCGLPRGSAALVLEPESPRPLAEIGKILAGHLGFARSDGVARARYGGGVLLQDVSVEAADALGTELAAAGIRTRRVEAALLSGPYRVRRARSLTFTPERLIARISGGEVLEVPRGELAGMHLYALPASAARDRESSSAELPPEVHRRTFTIFRRSSRRSRHPPASSFPALEAFLERGPDRLATIREPGAAGASARQPAAGSLPGNKLREALSASGDQPPCFFLTVFLKDGSRPLRFSQEDADYSSLGERKHSSSLDNFLIVLGDLLSFAPQAWLADRVAGFLERLDPAEVLYFKPEEGQNLERWMQLWIRLSRKA
jgi:hypothetical protein